jgi:hypothetical protein
MTTRLSDVVVPEVFNRYMVADTKEKSAIFQSGIMRTDGNVSGFLSGGGLTVNIPFWKDLDNTEANISTDNPATASTPRKVDAGRSVAIRQQRNQSWATMDLSGELAGSDPMSRIRSRVSDYWIRQFQRTLVNTLTGVFADNAANDSGDMILDIGSDSSGGVTAAELISAEAIIDCKQTMGDAADSLDVLIMHSVAYSRLQKLNLIDFIPDARGEIQFPTYLGYRVVVDDNVRKVAGSNRTKYWTYLVGAGAIAWGESPVSVPVEVDRKPELGNGSGQEILYTRRQYVMHPYGFRWMDATRTSNFPTNAEIATTNNWDRVFPERKQIALAALVTNG